MKKPLISIVTVCYNSASTLEETILSVLGQDYELLDYVIIDGGSTDRTIELIEKYKDKLGYYHSEPDRGISDAFNKGIAHAKGDIIGIINSDDILLPGALESMAQAYDGESDLYRGNTIIVNPETGFRGREIPSMHFPLAPCVIHVAHQGTFISKEAYQRWGLYNIQFRYMMDFDLITRMYRAGAKMKQVDYDIAEFRIGGISLTPLYKKKYDIKHVVLDNGGSKLLANYFYAYMWSFDLAKRVFVSLFGLDRLKRLHYKRNEKK